jgi:DNA modification methylase
VAAKQLGRRYFGCDISPTYIGEAMERLANGRAKSTSNGHKPLKQTASANGTTKDRSRDEEQIPLLHATGMIDTTE